MNSLQFLSHLIEQYGLYAVFFLALVEGDITLLLAGVLAHGAFFDDYSFAKVLLWGTLGGFASDNLAFAAGRVFGKTVRDFRFYRIAKPRIERLTDRFGILAGARGAVDRQATLRSAIDWSWNLLSPTEQMEVVLERLEKTKSNAEFLASMQT